MYNIQIYRESRLLGTNHCTTNLILAEPTVITWNSLLKTYNVGELPADMQLEVWCHENYISTLCTCYIVFMLSTGFSVLYMIYNT